MLVSQRSVVRELLRGDARSEPTAEQEQPIRLAPATNTTISVGDPDDPEEREADTIARRVVSGSVSSPASTTAPAGQLPELGQGAPLSAELRAFFEPRFGRSLDHVRLHRGAAAQTAAEAVDARAFAYGSDIVFGRGEYAPQTERGRLLLAHELAHTLQPSAGPRRKIRRVTHGPSTPTNCHNWKIPLPPWIAGALAHAQAAIWFATNPGGAGRIYPEIAMPRGTKLLMGVPNPPAVTPPGFMDLIGVAPGLVQVGEIKSTASAALATPEATHYVLRHTEWLTRMPHTAGIDLSYFATLGGPWLAQLMSGLAGVTGSGISVGPFVGDPGKTLWVEADTSGAIVYWCTGVGVINPAWALALRRLFQEVKRAFWEAYRRIKQAVDAVGEWVADHPVAAFFILLCLVIIGLILAILGGLLEVPSLGTSTPVTIGGVALTVSAAIALLALIGIDTSGFESSSNDVLALIGPPQDEQASGADYERIADQGNWRSVSATAGSDQLTAAIQRMAAATGSLPGQIGSRALSALNPLSSEPGLPSPEQGRAAVARSARLLTQNRDPAVAAIGTEVLERLQRA